MENNILNKTKENSNPEPLVSIIVITYNSTAHVLETLESIRDQTYANIELIITDDASTDDTLEKCMQWIDKNSARFSNTIMLESPVNLGISANCNKGVKAANGEWIKLIAADDFLLNDAIESNIDFIKSSNEPVHIIHSESLYYRNNFDEQNRIEGEVFGNQLITNGDATAEIQYQILLRGCHVNTPTVFINKEVFSEVGLFDEQFRNIEDWPMWIRVADAGIKFHFLNKPTVRYRMHDASVSNQVPGGKLYKELSLTEWPIYKKLVINNVPKFEKFLIIALEQRRKLMIKAGLNRNNSLSRSLDYLSIWPIKKLQLLAEQNAFKKLKKRIRK